MKRRPGTGERRLGPCTEGDVFLSRHLGEVPAVCAEPAVLLLPDLLPS